MLARMRRKGNPHALLVQVLIGSAIRETVWKFLKKLKLKLKRPEIAPPGIYPKEMKLLSGKDASMLIAKP